MEKISKISLIAFQGHLLEKQTVGILIVNFTFSWFDL